MVIGSDTIAISFFPFVTLTEDVIVQVWHKNTKVMVSGNDTPTITGTLATITLPNLTNISNVANDLDQILVRVLSEENNLLWEYFCTWSNSSTNINNTFKTFNTTGAESPEWLTL